MRQKLLQNAAAFLLQNVVKFYYKTRQLFHYRTRQFYHKMLQVLQNASILLQNVINIAKRVIYYKTGHNKHDLIFIFDVLLQPGISFVSFLVS